MGIDVFGQIADHSLKLIIDLFLTVKLLVEYSDLIVIAVSNSSLFPKSLARYDCVYLLFDFQIRHPVLNLVLRRTYS